MPPRVHTFSYFLSPRDKKRDVRAHQRRDDAAAMEVLKGLQQLGYLPGEAFLNWPPGQVGVAKSLHVDLSRVKDGDRILLTTRPPLHDRHQGDRKQVPRGHTDLEERIFAVVGRFVARCARSHLVLADDVESHLRAGFEGLAEMKFREAQGAPLRRLNAHDGRGEQDPPPGERATALFLLHLPSMGVAEGPDPGLLCAFGMDGTATLAWAYRLGHDLAHLLAEPRFLVARAMLGRVPRRATDLRWAEDWAIEVALDLPLAGPRPAQRPALRPPRSD